MKEALLYDTLDEEKVRCRLCSHHCLILPGKTGICGVRQNDNGRLNTLVYGRAISSNLDPIEKKPLFHFLPGTLSFSIATVGCNLSCQYCQNHEISQMPRDHQRIVGQYLAPEDVVRQAADQGAASIAYTYTEPTIYFEYALDIARLATRAGLKNIFVTNGFMTEEALDMIGTDLTAANVDLKAFSKTFYRNLCGARLEPVKETIRRMKERGVWVEVTTLLIPDRNDDEKELGDLARWLAGIDPQIPWHISRFRPMYHYRTGKATANDSIAKAREIGLDAGLQYVYSGNVWGDSGEKTYCPGCGTRLIDRVGFTVSDNRLLNGTCPECGKIIAGIWGG
jgi:pyruvate formate lyase activating enzyme